MTNNNNNSNQTAGLPSVEYINTSLNTMSLSRVKESDSPRVVTKISLGGQEFEASSRFLKSFYKMFDIHPKVFKIFGEDEVFDKIVSNSKKDVPFRVGVESFADSKKLLAVSNPDIAPIELDFTKRLCNDFGGEMFKYSDGIASFSFLPSYGEHKYDLNEGQGYSQELFSNKFRVDIPVDAFGTADVNLYLERLVCLNGMSAFGKAFGTSIIINSEESKSRIIKALEGQNDEKTFVLLNNRFRAAQTSLVSIAEFSRFYSDLQILEAPAYMLHKLERMAGNYQMKYGISNIADLPASKARQLPTELVMYDLVNFCTEVATHHVVPAKGKTIYKYLTSLLSNTFDLENILKEPKNDFVDVFAKAA